MSEDILEFRLQKLEGILKNMEKVLVAFSGGVDSTFLLEVAHRVLKDGVVAFTGISETYTEEERKRAEEFCRERKIKHILLKTRELEDENFKKNPPDRCYYCKRELFSKAFKIAKKFGLYYVVDGTNMDDLHDYRPGRRACEEMKVRSPLLEAGFSKEDIREISRRMELKSWDLPASPCLASRFEYGVSITEKNLKMVERGERFLRDRGFKIVRVRFLKGEVSKIEVDREEMSKFASLELREELVKYFKGLGFKRVYLDLEGYRMGNLNENLNIKNRESDNGGYNL